MTSIKLEEENSFTSLISVDLIEYQKKNNNKAVKKTLSIPQWLNDLAEENKINYSKVLQTSLMELLDVNN